MIIKKTGNILHPTMPALFPNARKSLTHKGLARRVQFFVSDNKMSTYNGVKVLVKRVSSGGKFRLSICGKIVNLGGICPKNYKNI